MPRIHRKISLNISKKIKELLKKLKIKKNDDYYIMVAKDCLEVIFGEINTQMLIKQPEIIQISMVNHFSKWHMTNF